MTLVELITRHESLRLRVYDDANGEDVVPGYVMVGHPTIGYGRALDVNGISQHEAEALRSVDLNKATTACARVVGDIFGDLDGARRAALISMAYQMGEGGLADFVNMLGAVRERNWAAASREALRSAWAQQTPSRAKEIAAMLLTGAFPHG